MRPTNKVSAGVLAGAIVAILAWAAKAFGHVEMPAEVGVGLSTVITFGVQYLVPDAAQDPTPAAAGATSKDPSP